MSLLRASLRLLPLLVLAAGCTGKRADPEPGQSAPQSTEGGGGTTGNGGSPGTGGDGGTPSTGGAPSNGGAPGMGGMGGAGPSTATGSVLNLAADIYPFCGCLDDAQDTGGACDNCIAGATCVAEAADCPAQCMQIVAALRACTFNDLACYDAAYNLAPPYFDDAVALINCECGACSDPVCDGSACTP